MKLAELSDASVVYSLLDDREVDFEKDYKDKFQNQKNVVALRIHGLVGDCIKATTIISAYLRENPEQQFVVLVSYNDASKRGIVKDLFSKLVEKNIIVGLFFNEFPLIGNVSFHQFQFLRSIGCENILDLYFYNSEVYNITDTGPAYLGFENLEIDSNKIALFRFSGFHQHVPLRHIPEEEWLTLEFHLLHLGYDVHLYGYDDTMSTAPGVIDHRRELSVLETIEHASNAGLCISTTTFLPLYLHHRVPCLVYIDPKDMNAVSLLWRDSHNYMPINTQSLDHLDYVKDFATKHKVLAQSTDKVLEELTNLVRSQAHL